MKDYQLGQTHTGRAGRVIGVLLLFILALTLTIAITAYFEVKQLANDVAADLSPTHLLLPIDVPYALPPAPQLRVAPLSGQQINGLQVTAPASDLQ